MSFPPIVYVAAAVAHLIWTSEDDGSYFSYPSTELEFVNWFGNTFRGSIDLEQAAAAIAVLDEVGLVTFDEDEFAGRFLKVDPHAFRDRWQTLASNSPDSPFGKSSTYGLTWLRAVFDNSNFWERLNSTEQSRAGAVLPDGLSRRPEPLVYIVEGSAEGKELREGLDNLAEQLRSNNEIGSEPGEDRPRLMAEVKASQDLVAGGAVRISAMREVLIKVLRELARRLKDKAMDLGIEHLLQIALRILS